MKRLATVIVIFVIFWGLRVNAQSQYSAVLAKMENSLFGMDYPAQSDDARIKRIEETVYGSSSSSPLPQRVDKLSKDLSADLIGQEIKPKKDTFAEDDNNPQEQVPKADKNVNYPIVNNLEKEVFKQEFKDTEINQRLANLEQKVFKKTYNDDLNSRVERLKAAVMPESITTSALDDDDEIISKYNQRNIDSLMDETAQFQDYNYERPDDNKGNPTGYGASVPSYNRNNSVLDSYHSNSDTAIELSQLERVILKKSFPDDVISNRLIRLELKVFNSTFTDDDEQTRMDRIASAYQAKKSSKKYDSNKFAQHAATAMQVGAFLLMILAMVL